MSIYTKRGDKGKTGLFVRHNSQEIRISKSSAKINAIGSIDELNSFLGIVSAFSDDEKLKNILEEIQENLFRIGSIMAGSGLKFKSAKTKDLEKTIDAIDKKVPKLSNFIFMGGCREAALMHYARSIARRTERFVVELSGKEKVNTNILKYLNRLSDTLFMLAREANKKAGIVEKIWKTS